MTQDLFDSIVGSFMDGTPIESVPPRDRILWSIRDNLARLFSAREGIQPHLKGFGLPDISEIYREMPHGIKRLKEAIETSVARYEPRLSGVSVIYKKNDANPFAFEFSIIGSIAGRGEVAFTANMPATGRPSVSLAKKENG